MKKKLVLIISFILIIVLIIINILVKKNNSNNLLNNYLNNGSNLSYFYETETGEYTPGEAFSSLEGSYSLNTTRSSCDNGLDTIEWDDTNKRIIMTSGKSNRCKLYFDINKRFTLLSYYPITGRDAQITNLIKNGDYEEGDKYWSNNDNVSVTSETKSHGNNSLKFNAGNVTGLSTQVLDEKTPTFNHSYYGRLKFLSNANFSSFDSRYEWRFLDDDNIAKLTFIFKNLKYVDWTLMSNIVTLNSNEYTSQKWEVRNFQVNPNGESYTDELMMIDLTAGYGEDIPTKEELDSELIYFDGTVDIKSVTGKSGIFTVSNLPEDAEIECNNGGSAQISGSTVTITGNSAQTTCYIKEVHVPSIFDKCPGSTDLVSCLNNLNPTLVGDENTTTTQCPNGIGGVIKHDGTIDAKDDGTVDDAKDNGYRYSGCNPNNYICFGKGSEAYNRGETNVCPIKNKYRIIGVVPVTVGEETKNLVKVIKAEYLTEDEFGTKAGTASVNSAYDGIKRIESSQSGIPAYKWNDTSNNNWSESTLYTSLNSDDSNGYKDKAFGDTWLNKIETVRWNVGGVGSSFTSNNAQKMYEEEMKGQGATTPVNAQIGLMYLHDYGFASSSDNWQTEIYKYNKDENRNNNWLFNGINEWTISRRSSAINYAYRVINTGFVHSNFDVTYTSVAVRPVFYLKSTTQIIGDSTHNGSVAYPFKVQ